MNKFKQFLKTVPMKLYVLIAAFVILAFFSNDFGLVDIQKTAIILAAGVDRQEKDFTLSAQIAVPQSSASGGTTADTVTVVASGETISACLTDIFAQTGWVPKLVFCDLVILGEQAAKNGAMHCLDFFLRNDYMPDSAKVAVCEGTAEKMLTSTSALDDSPSQAIGRLFTDSAVGSGRSSANTLKQFAIDYYGASKSGYMPFLRTKIQESTSAGGGSGEGSSEGSGKPQVEAVTYSAEETAIFQDGEMVGILSPQETFAFALTQGKVYAGTFCAEENGSPVSLSILKNKGGVSLDTKSNPKAEVNVELTVRLHNRGVPAPVNDISEYTISDELLQNADKVIRGYIESLLSACEKAKCDLFNLRTQLYRSSLALFGEWKELVPFSIDTTVKTQLEKLK